MARCACSLITGRSPGHDGGESGGFPMSGQVMPHEVHGNGAHAVIGLHGWFSDRRGFGDLLPYLDRKRFRYVFVDYRGYGEAKGRAGSYTMDEIADDVLATADELGLREFSL